ncbi:YoaK family protein [Hephaestia sp. GCM10023244]|uniref:YoaK family protein n=1 Tax=unclassified Hephaestia TaxID=2631281 RepID=UPI0020774441|nr:YoaK family protein [Hephaestia sp. MAHUQ-44]MCM8730863.1 YoaK family protein [Hephaestia sp. MAHUQ-44]
MQRYQTPMITAAVLLAILAGFVDAIAYISLGGFFASFMSGNTTRLGVGLATGAAADAWNAGALILAFVCGVMGASILSARFARWRKPVVMTAVAACLAIAAGAAHFTFSSFPLLLLAAAMGAENGVFLRDREVSIGVTYMTGTLVRTGQKLADALLGRGDALGWVPHLLLWLGFAGGVVLGGTTLGDRGLEALWFAAGGALALAALLAVLTRHGDAA